MLFLTSKDNFKRGNIEMMLLFLLKEKELYGYELSQSLTERSRGLFSIQDGTMYPTLYRLVDRGMITDRIEKAGKRRTRVYYHITEEGEEYLKKLIKEYNSVNEGIMNVFNSINDESYDN